MNFQQKISLEIKFQEEGDQEVVLKHVTDEAETDVSVVFLGVREQGFPPKWLL